MLVENHLSNRNSQPPFDLTSNLKKNFKLETSQEHRLKIRACIFFLTFDFGRDFFFVLKLEMRLGLSASVDLIKSPCVCVCVYERESLARARAQVSASAQEDIFFR